MNKNHPARREATVWDADLDGRLSTVCVTKKRASGLPSTMEHCSKMDSMLGTK